MTLGKRTVDVTGSFAGIDFHTHILPSLDHGSESVLQSQKQLCRLSSAKVKTVCATSHFYPNETTVGDFICARAAALEELTSSVASPRPDIILGAEVLMCEGLEDMEGLVDLCFEGTRTLLLELPLGSKSISDSMYETVLAIREKGIIPVLAHVDRYPRELIEPLVQDGIFAQINTVGVSGMFRSRHIEEWIDKGFVVAIGSDYHFVSDRGVECFERLSVKRPDMMSLLSERADRILQNAIRR